jgi:hypothetical protein
MRLQSGWRGCGSVRAAFIAKNAPLHRFRALPELQALMAPVAHGLCPVAAERRPLEWRGHFHDDNDP